MSEYAMRGKVAVVGVGTTEQGTIPDKSADEIAVDAIRLALADAGIDKSQIDGLYTGRNNSGHGMDINVAKLAGLSPAQSGTLLYGTAQFSLALGALSIVAGIANTVLIVYGTNYRSERARFGLERSSNAGELYGFLHETGMGALAFRRHQYLYGTTEAQLGMVAVAEREWARMNPLAIFRDPLTLEDYLKNPYMVEPMRRLDSTMISDGGVAFILSSAERARDYPHKPVYLLSNAQIHPFRELQIKDNYMRPWLKDVADEVYARAQLGPQDIDVALFQDPVSVWVLQMLEHFGFCGIGESGPFVAAGHTRPGGKLPVNTNGGQLSEAYMWGWLPMAEAVRQVRGECGERQVPGAEVALFASTDSFIRGAASIFASHT